LYVWWELCLAGKHANSRAPPLCCPSRFLLRCGTGDGGGDIELRVWGSEVAVLSAAAAAGDLEEEEEQEGAPALKVSYRIQDEEGEEEEVAASGDATESKGCCGGHEEATTAVPPPSEALELTLPLEEWHAVREKVTWSAIGSISPICPGRGRVTDQSRSQSTINNRWLPCSTPRRAATFPPRATRPLPPRASPICPCSPDMQCTLEQNESEFERKPLKSKEMTTLKKNRGKRLDYLSIACLLFPTAFWFFSCVVWGGGS
jgi:hypothetical protein